MEEAARKRRFEGVSKDLLVTSEDEETLKRTALLQGTEGKIAIVGAGISGIEAAKIFLSCGHDVVLFEQHGYMAGIWLRAANVESRVQVDPISFRPIEDTSAVRVMDPFDPFDTISSTRDEVVQRVARDVAAFGLRSRVLFHMKVVDFASVSPQAVRVNVCHTPSNTVYTLTFRQLHIRTGCLNQSVTMAQYLGLDEYGGRYAQGIGCDVDLSEFEGKDVVVVGLGAFATENVRRALMGHARSIVLLARVFNKPWFPEYATYTLRRTLQSDDALCDTQVVTLWRRVHDILATVASHCHVTPLVMNSHTVRFFDGEPVILFNNGVPSMSSNSLYLACHYGLCRCVQGEIERFTHDGVQLRSGETLRADVVVGCLGFDCNYSLLHGHCVQDSWFVDGKANITHNLRGDRVNGTGMLGATVRHQNFLISYYEDAQEYERCIIRLNENPDTFAELKAMDPVKNVMDVKAVDYFTTLDLSEKLSKLSDPEIQRILAENRARRKMFYDTLLTEEMFLEADYKAWMKLSQNLASRTGQDVLPYPFLNEKGNSFHEDLVK